MPKYTRMPNILLFLFEAPYLIEVPPWMNALIEATYWQIMA